jgi:cardiolipin synthase
MLGNIAQWGLTAFVLVAAAIGVLFVTRGTAVRRVRGVGVDGVPVGVSEPDFAATVALLAGGVILPGNKVELALNGDGTYERLWADLRSATESITIQMYYAEPGRVADQLSKILIERALSGVRVFLLYDAFGAGGLKRSYLAAMRDAGIRVVAFRPLRFRNLWVVQNRSHIRGIVIDRRVGWTGGFGVDDKWLGDGQTDLAWRDTNIRFEGPAVYQLQAAFVAAWAEATGELFSGRVAVTYQDEGVEAAGLLATTPTLGSTAAERFLALSIAGAQKKLFITNAYFAPDRSFVALLVAAADRGVDVRVLLGGPRTDVRVARRAAHSRYDRLLVAGVRVYEYQPSTLHAKTFVVDGCWTAVGTMNFDNRSLALNDECTLMVLDKTFGSQMEDVFLADLGRSAQINLQEFRKRTQIARIAEWGANLITSLL